jgi:hypothetical protein
MYKILLVFLVFILLAIVLSHLLKKRQIILQLDNAPKTLEGMMATVEVDALKRVYKPVKIKNVISSIQKLPLRELCIKASYSSAWSGTYISTDMIKLILSRGYRYLDIPIYYGNDSIPYVFYSNDTNMIDPVNTIPLDNVFKTIASSAFSNVSPNSGDPLFIELRITPDTNGLIYDSIANLITSNFLQKMYIDANNRSKIINSSTTLNNLMGKIIFFINFNGNENFASKSQNLSFLMNGILGQEEFLLKNYRQVTVNFGYTYSVTSYNMPPITNVIKHSTIMPDATESYPIPNIHNMVLNFGCQNFLIPFYANDPMISLYETVFDDQSTAFVPMGNMLINAEVYLNSKNPAKSKIKYGAF